VVGRTLATTPGAVVFRSEVFELIQYLPQSEKVSEYPLLMVPPVINKYYVLDLAPGRSLIEYLLREGQQVFAISWRNPDARHGDWGLDVYGQAILDAITAVEDISASPRTHVFAACSGGILAAMTLAHLAHVGELDRIAALTLAVTVLDQAQAGQAAAIVDERVAKAAIAASAARGYLDGSALAEVFAWLRPNDLIWTYWVNNYLQGRKPASFYGAPITEETAEQWLKAASARPGSWWPHYTQWLASRSGGERDAPAALGGMTLPPLDPAPGTYVFDA
jgi:poly(3-hydroxyalkanoate) synthetase